MLHTVFGCLQMCWHGHGQVRDMWLWGVSASMPMHEASAQGCTTHAHVHAAARKGAHVHRLYAIHAVQLLCRATRRMPVVGLGRPSAASANVHPCLLPCQIEHMHGSTRAHRRSKNSCATLSAPIQPKSSMQHTAGESMQHTADKVGPQQLSSSLLPSMRAHMHDRLVTWVPEQRLLILGWSRLNSHPAASRHPVC
jgi:hypothetical protein